MSDKNNKIIEEYQNILLKMVSISGGKNEDEMRVIFENIKLLEIIDKIKANNYTDEKIKSLLDNINTEHIDDMQLLKMAVLSNNSSIVKYINAPWLGQIDDNENNNNENSNLSYPKPPNNLSIQKAISFVMNDQKSYIANLLLNPDRIEHYFEGMQGQEQEIDGRDVDLAWFAPMDHSNERYKERMQIAYDCQKMCLNTLLSENFSCDEEIKSSIFAQENKTKMGSVAEVALAYNSVHTLDILKFKNDQFKNPNRALFALSLNIFNKSTTIFSVLRKNKLHKKLIIRKGGKTIDAVLDKINFDNVDLLAKWTIYNKEINLGTLMLCSILERIKQEIYIEKFENANIDKNSLSKHTTNYIEKFTNALQKLDQDDQYNLIKESIGEFFSNDKNTSFISLRYYIEKVADFDNSKEIKDMYINAIVDHATMRVLDKYKNKHFANASNIISILAIPFNNCNFDKLIDNNHIKKIVDAFLDLNLNMEGGRKKKQLIFLTEMLYKASGNVFIEKDRENARTFFKLVYDSLIKINNNYLPPTILDEWSIYASKIKNDSSVRADKIRKM